MKRGMPSVDKDYDRNSGKCLIKKYALTVTYLSPLTSKESLFINCYPLNNGVFLTKAEKSTNLCLYAHVIRR